MELKLNDILRFSPEQIAHAKIALNISRGSGGTRCFDCWQADNRDPAERDVGEYSYWYYVNRPNFHVGDICVGFVQLYDNTKWLLVTVGEVISVPKESGACEYRQLPEYAPFLGRVIVSVAKGNTMGRWLFNLGTYLDQCIVIKICDKVYKEDKAFSLDSIHLNYEELKDTVEGRKNETLRKLLENIKGVYCLTDTKTGKLYIGSATADDNGIAQRWGVYFATNTGYNRALCELRAKEGDEYFKQNFTFTVIEYFGMQFDDKKITDREAYWKKVFDTIEHGYNRN